jgi:chromosome segregation protein
MQGFKSFPERTKMTFEGGMTAIIGPNGSGKSNISDSIRWVLGEMSAKSLRGARMEDVIFNGTPKRPAANYAVVSLFLDTSEEYMAHRGVIADEPEESGLTPRQRVWDAEEAVITRKYYRTGESEYYINKKQVRLKDIYEFFYDTGIGREGYSVIGQGKIAEVLSVKGDERRSIFEEASGISKFRIKKTETERKLRDTDSNLDRVRDIFAEVESRVEPLRKEAENAGRFIALSEEKKKLEVTIWLERIDMLRGDLESAEKALASSKLELDLAGDELDAVQREEDEFNNHGYALLQRRSALDERSVQLSEESAVLTQSNAVFETESRHYREKIESNARESALVSGRKAASEELASACRRAIEDIASAAEQLKKQGEEFERERERIMEPARSAEEERAKENAAISAANDRLTEIIKRTSSCRALIASAEKRGGDNTGLVEESRARLNELTSRRDSLSAREKEITNDLSNTRARINEINGSIAKTESEREKHVSLVNKANIRSAAAEQERESLLRLERLFEGYSDSVKTVMRQASEGRIKCQGRPIDLRGTVASLLSAEGEYVVAMETALGASVQFIVSGSEKDAKAAINHLKTTGGGRITVLPLDTVKGRRCDVSRIKDCDGFVGVASDLIICDKEYKCIADELLGRTVIAEDLDKASVMAAKCGYSVKIVTKDGQIINAGGSYTGGSPQKKVGLFTRSADIDKLDAEISELNTALMQAELGKRSAEKRLDSLKEELARQSARAEELSAQAEQARTDLSFAEATRGEEESKLTGMLESDRRNDEEKQTLASELEELEAEEAKIRKAKNVSEMNVIAAEEAIAKANAASEDIRSSIADVNMQLVTLGARREAEQDKLDAILGRVREDDEKLAEIASETEECESAIRTGAETFETNLRKLADIENEKTAISAEKKDIDKELEEREKTVPERKMRLREAQIRREQAFQSHTRLESGKQAAQDEYDSVSGKLWDEYELTYSDAEAFRLPVEEREKMPTRLNSVKAKIRAMGVINVKAVDEYRELKERYDFLKAQIDDLDRTRRKLDNELSRLDTKMKDVFLDTFARINSAFGRVFTELFGGGSARVELTDPSDPLGCGIDIILRPPGKSVRSISLLSGGEQSFAAIALYLALQEINPAPFCILDEIESALDEVNQAKLMDYIKAHCGKTQYLLITHRRGTMERADTLYGITMREKGVSEFLKLDLDTLGERFKDYTDDKE